MGWIAQVFRIEGRVKDASTSRNANRAQALFGRQYSDLPGQSNVVESSGTASPGESSENMTGVTLHPRQALSRIGIVLGIFGALLFAPNMVRSLEMRYPLSAGAAGSLQYVGFSFVMLLLAVLFAVVWVWPSWVIAARLRPDDRVEVRALRATVISFILQPTLHATIIGVFGRDMPPDRYRLVALVTHGVLLLAATLSYPPTAGRPDWRPRLAALVGIMVAVSLALVSRVAWADFNPDGTELFTMGRSLSAFAIPRVPTGEIPGVNLGMLPIAFPVDLILTLGGLSPVSVRLPALAYIAAAGLGVAGLVEHRARRELSTAEFTLLLAGVAAVCLTISYNASYDPYSTDIASPASIDVLSLVFLVAALHFFFAGEAGWCIATSMIQSLSRPSAPLLCLMLVAAVFLVERDVRSARLKLAVGAAASTLLVSLVYVFAMEALTGSQVGEGGGNLVSRIRFLRFDDWSRLAYLIVPSGILPAVTLVRWKQLDQKALVLALVSLAYFAFFYTLAFTSLHHFAPAMLLPLAVFWLHAINRERSGGVLQVGILTGVAVAVFAAMPQSMAPFRASREVANSIALEAGDPRRDMSIDSIFAASRVLDSLFAPYWSVRDPQRERVGDPISLAWYASRARVAASTARYVVQPEQLAPPAGTTRLATTRGFSLYTRDVAAWQRQRTAPPPLDVRSPLYDVPRTTLFQHLGRDAGLVQLDLKDVACGILRGLPGCEQAAAPRGN